MDTQTLLAQLDFTHSRTLGLLDKIEKSGSDVAAVLAWRPGPGRAHLAWQAMHLAAVWDKYLNVRLKDIAGGGDGQPDDPQLVANYGGGSTPTDGNVPSLADIRAAMAKHFSDFRSFLASQTSGDLARDIDFGPNQRRTLGESIMLLTWHEAHHQGQMHLTWNLFKAAHAL